jgi:hypothetical protein
MVPGTDVVNNASTATANKTNKGIQVGFCVVMFLFVKGGYY